ncbi:hypothetical protein O3P69_018709 [Scylla paramamosain]|uniref:Uncharacterized protein n=1 Tax=Scylla paramamosain TaxID=85552 RepID=A0AAW0SUK1_SCYPA
MGQLCQSALQDPSESIAPPFLFPISTQHSVTTLARTPVHTSCASVITQQIQQDWVNREYIEVITSNIKRIADFLNSFDMSCRSKLSQLNEKLTMLERRIEYLEARVTKGETLN